MIKCLWFGNDKYAAYFSDNKDKIVGVLWFDDPSEMYSVVEHWQKWMEEV